MQHSCSKQRADLSEPLCLLLTQQELLPGGFPLLAQPSHNFAQSLLLSACTQPSTCLTRTERWSRIAVQLLAVSQGQKKDVGVWVLGRDMAEPVMPSGQVPIARLFPHCRK